MNDFDGYIAMQTGVPTLIDSGHPSFTNLSNDLIFVNDIANQNSPRVLQLSNFSRGVGKAAICHRLQDNCRGLFNGSFCDVDHWPSRVASIQSICPVQLSPNVLYVGIRTSVAHHQCLESLFSNLLECVWIYGKCEDTILIDFKQ